MDKLPFAIQVPAGMEKKVKAKNVNMDGSDDQFYRYKMPQLISFVLGKGKMVKTMLCNVNAVCASLKRPPSYLPTYIGYCLSAQSKYDAKKPDGENAQVSGEVSAEDLSNFIEKFIEEWVSCPNCKLPECNLETDKKAADITFVCSGCGARETVKKSIAVNQPKFFKYILNHPPDSAGGTQEIKGHKKGRDGDGDIEGSSSSSKKKDRKEKKKKKDKDRENGDEDSGDGDAADDAADDGESKEKKKKKKKDKDRDDDDDSKEKKKKKKKDKEKDKDREGKKKDKSDDEIEWHTDTSKEAAEQRRLEFQAQNSAVVLEAFTTGEKEAPASPSASKTEEVTEAMSKTKLSDPTDEAVTELAGLVEKGANITVVENRLHRLADESNLTEDGTIKLFVRSIFHKENFTKNVKAYSFIIKALLDKPVKMKYFFKAFESAVAPDAKAMAKQAQAALLHLFEQDILIEAALLAWGQHKSTDAGVKAAIKPFIEWLAEASSDDSDESD